MEYIVIIALVGYIAYRFFKSSIVSKSLVATEIQRLFDTISQLSLAAFHGNYHLAAQEYTETYWDKVKDFQKDKPRVLALAIFVLLHTLKELHNRNDENTDFVLQALGRALGEIQASAQRPNQTEAMMVGFALKSFLKIVEIRDMADATTLQAVGQPQT